MPTIRMNITEWKAYQWKLAANYKPTLMRGVLSGAKRCLAYIQKRTRDAKAVDTGAYLRAWKAEPTDAGAHVYNAAPYSPIIEYGRRSGARQPPVAALISWVKHKLGIKDEEARSVAFLIARAIGRRGLPARRIATAPEAITEMTKIVGDEIQHEIDRMLVSK